VSLETLQDGKPVHGSLKSPFCSCVSITLPAHQKRGSGHCARRWKADCVCGTGKGDSKLRPWAAYLAYATCAGAGFIRNTATTFDVFYRLQVTKFDVPLLQSAPNRLDYIDILGLWLHVFRIHGQPLFALTLSGCSAGDYTDFVKECVFLAPSSAGREVLGDHR
jgi:hypothetical protein